MRIGILGSGMVAQSLGGKLAECGHEVKLGTRDPGKLADWLGKTGHGASVGSFADAAAFGEIVFNCTAGSASLDALQMAGPQNFDGKILVDVANPLDFSHGMPPTLTVCNTDSLGEQIQRALPRARVVKSLNTMNTYVMANPALVPGDHAVFVSGDDADAKAQVTALLQNDFGWHTVIDLGGIQTSRGVEMILPLWVNLMGVFQTPMFNFQIARQGKA